MNIIIHVKEALANLITAKLRSFLAILGILVGTASVVALITSSQLATAHALAQFKSLGTNLLALDLQQRQNVATSVQGRVRQLTLADMPKISAAATQIVAVAPYINLFQTIVIKGKQINGQVIGATSQLAKIVKIHMASGRFVSYLDRSSFYCVIGKDLVQTLKAQGIDNPIGQQIQVGNWLFTIIGTAQHWAPNWFLFAEIDKGLIIPLDTSYLLSRYARINNILFRLVPQPNIDRVQQQLTAALKHLLPTQQVRFRNPQQIIGIMQKQQATFTWLLGSIGGIALLVGGIGVMNIMLVSVVERRREIGIRMAIGARRVDIRRMFLVEAVILTLFGGLVGIVVGIAIALILALISGWQFLLLPLPPLLGFVVSVVVGIISGFYPAYRASKLDPIATLRAE